MRRGTLFTLLVLNAALAALLGWLWFTPEGELRSVHWEPPAAQKTDYRAMLPAVSDSVPVDTSQFVALLERPLFSPTRRPPPPPPPPEPVIAALVDNLSTARLMGIFQGQAGGGVILKIAGVDRRVKVNEAVDGWTLQSISGNTVTFAGRGQSRTLTLQRAALTSPAGMPAAAQSAVPSPSSVERPTPSSRAPEPSSAGAVPSAESGRAAPPQAAFGGSSK